MRKRGWPAGLYERRGYYSWRSPVDGREYGIGRDRDEALAEATEANLHVLGISTKARLIDRLTGSGDRTLGAWIEKFRKALDKRDLAANTKKTNAWRLRQIEALLGADTPIARIETLQIAEALETYTDAGKARAAQSLRSCMLDLFRGAVAAGWIRENPVIVTERVTVEVQRARLTFDIFTKLYEQTKHTWLRNAMALAIVSAQARDNIASATFTEIRDGGWWFERTKTGKKIMLPLELRLDRFGMSLEDVVRQCRRSGAVSKYLIHQTRPRGNSPVGQRIFVDTMSKAFAAEVDALGMTWGDRTPPTFHELRSLSERLYKEQGNVDTQQLLGHEDARTTRMYDDARGAEYARVKVGSR